MDLKMKGQLALVTGSTSGHGKEVAKVLLEEGARVVINSFSQEELDSVKEELSALGEAYFIKADVTKDEEVTHLMDEVYKLGDLDILVNNVGYWQDDDFWDIDDALWDKMLQLNFMGGIRTMRYALPKMLESNYGRIVNVASEIASKPGATQVHYSVCKAAVVAATHGVAQWCRGKNVLVNSIQPGPMWTPTEIRWQENAAAENGRTLEEHVQHFLEHDEPQYVLQRYLMPEEVAKVTAFYCSPVMTTTQGAAVRADGSMIHHI
ncbi:MAG: SDR family oxidoreductase [Eubacterium sp.]|nr:SDR family oxidoreductase [Eubacterium sp.]